MCVWLEWRLNTPNEILRSLMSCAFIAANHVRRTHTLTFTAPPSSLCPPPPVPRLALRVIGSFGLLPRQQVAQFSPPLAPLHLICHS